MYDFWELKIFFSWGAKPTYIFLFPWLLAILIVDHDAVQHYIERSVFYFSILFIYFARIFL